MKAGLGLLLVGFLLLSRGVASGTTTAERLGFGPEDRVLIVHADDVGMCHSVNRATFDAMERGLVTCGSIMIPCPWVLEVADYCRKHPEADFGLHLTLTSEWKFYRWGPVAPRHLVKGLLDPLGYLWPDVPYVVQHASPEEVEREIRAQIERALALGIRPTHLDSHMGTLYARPDYLEVFLKVAREYRIPPMLVRWSEDLERTVKRMGLPAEEIRALTERAEREGFVLLDYLVTGVEGKSFEERKRAYHKVLKNLKPGVTEIIVHPGMDDEELRAIAGSAPQRYADYLVFTDLETRRLIEKLGIKLIGWRELSRLAWREAAGGA